MGRSSVLRYLHSFIPAEQTSGPLSGDDANHFLSCLHDDLEKLERSLSNGPVNLQWSAHAMSLLKNMQVELLNLLKNSELTISYGSKQDWFDQYMEETTTLLDFCNSIKSAVSGINRYCILADLTINDAEQNLDLKTLENEYKRIIESKKDFTEALKLDFACEDRNKNSVVRIMLAVKSTVVVLSFLVLSTIISFPAVEMMNSYLNSDAKLNPLWEILRSLVVRFQEAGGGSPEHEEVGGLVMGNLKMVVDGEDKKQRYLKDVELLRSKSDELREKVEKFDSVVDQVFDVVIKARNEMLGAFRDGAL